MAEVPEDLKQTCARCSGNGSVEVNSFSSSGEMDAGGQPRMHERSCHICKGRGWVWCKDQEEMSAIISALESSLREARETIQRLSAPMQTNQPSPPACQVDEDEFEPMTRIAILREINLKLCEEVARLRASLISIGRSVGCMLADDVSTDFLMNIPAEVEAVEKAHAGHIASLKQQIAEEREVLAGPIEDCDIDAALKAVNQRANQHDRHLMQVALAACVQLRRASLEKQPDHSDLRKIIDANFGTIEEQGADKYNECLGFAVVIKEEFAALVRDMENKG